MKIKDMKARIKAQNELGTFYSNYKNVSLHEINQMKQALMQDAMYKTSFTLEDHYPDGKDYTTIPPTFMSRTIITLECQEG